jgi:hypothetical protein
VIHNLDPSLTDNVQEQRQMYKLKFGKKLTDDLPSSFNVAKKASKQQQDDKMPDVPVDVLLKPLHPSELNKRCLRSLRYNHDDRAKSF